MKPLELTKEQKDKLLEMAKALFPEYSFRFGKNDYYGDKNNQYLWSDNKNVSDIHWFEFCLTYLANKIYFPDIQNIERDARNKIEKFYFSTFMEAIEGGPAGYDHPIDYLYIQFKKLTNEKDN